MSRSFKKYYPRKDIRQPRRVPMCIRNFSNKSFTKKSYAGAELCGSNFSNASLDRIKFFGANLERADFSGSVLTNIDFSKSNISDAVFQNATIKDCFFDEAIIRSANLSNVKAFKCSLWKSDLTAASLKYSQFNSCNLDRSELNNSNCFKVEFLNSTLRHIRAKNCVFVSANFQGSDLSRCEIFDSDMSLSYLSDSVAIESNFERVILSSSMCNRMMADGIKFKDCSMKMAQFSDSLLNNSSIKNCYIYGSSFWDIKDDGIIIENLDISPSYDGSLITTNLQFAPLLFIINQGKYFVDLIDIFRLKSVLILGSDGGDNYGVLGKIQKILKDMGYVGIIAKQQSNIDSDSAIKKVLSLAMLSKFVIIENSYASGHLFEIPFIRTNECLTIVLQEEGRGSTYMLDDMYGKYIFIKRYFYNNSSLVSVLKKSLKWAEKTNSDLSDINKKANHWLT